MFKERAKKYLKSIGALVKKAFNNKFAMYSGAVLIVLIFTIVIARVNRPDQVKSSKESVATSLVSLNKDISRHNYDAALKRLQANPASKENDLLIISLYMNKGDYGSAVKMYSKVIKNYGSNLGLLDGAGSAAESAKEYKQAINFYQQAEKLVQDEHGATWRADAQYYTNKIASLKAQNK